MRTFQIVIRTILTFCFEPYVASKMTLLTVILCCMTALSTSMPTNRESVKRTNVGQTTGDRSVEKLMADFRRQQMMSTSLLNSSLDLALKQKIAEAEIEEAEERKTKAWRGKNEAKTPFIATTANLNLGYIGRGYDIYYGNPLSDDGVVDQGFRLPVIDLPFSFRFTSDGSYRIPDGIDVISETSATFGTSYFQVKTESDYKGMLSVDASINVEGSGFGYEGSFSASTAYKKSKQEMQKGETTTINTVGRAVVYRARMSETAKMSKVSDYFEHAIKSLPIDHCEEDTIQDLYIRVIKEFGTHYTTELVMGAKAVQELRFRNSDLERLSSEGISASIAAKLSYKGIISAGASINVGVNSDEERRKKVLNTAKEQREYYIGGKPPSGDSSTAPTETLREWAKSAAENPVPIQYKLSSIETLLKPDWFKDITYGLYERRLCLRQALLRYCSRTIPGNLCNPVPGAYSRKKRSVDEAVTVKTIKYGDFVTIRNFNTYLKLAKNHGLAPGSAIKILTSGSIIQDYDGLFQLLPVKDEDRKLGSDVHYGEPFLLQSKEGAQFFMGRTLISDIESPSEVQIMDMADDIDDKPVSRTGNDESSDFSIFLKNDESSTYFVGLKTDCFVSKPRVLLLDIKGTIGTVKLSFSTRCACSGQYNSLCKTTWFHRFLVDVNIGTMKSITFMGMYGATTDIIKEIEIRKITNGKKEKFKQRNLTCNGRECTIQVTSSPESSTIPINMYAVQFAFHSKDQTQMEREPVKDRELGYINILSSIKKKKFWGQSNTQLISLGLNGRIEVKNQGPSEHKPVSLDCRDLVFPNNYAKSHSQRTSIVISFNVPVYMKYVEIDTTDATSYNFSISYVEPDAMEFRQIQEAKLKRIKENSQMLNVTISAPIYCTAAKIYLPDNTEKNISQIVAQLSIGGCHRALFAIEGNHTGQIEWFIQTSDNEIKTYPYLQVVPKSSNQIDIDKLKQDMEDPITFPISVVIPIPVDMADCEFDTAYFINVLTMSTLTSFMKFSNVKLTRQHNQLSSSSLLITLDLTAINKEEFDMGSVHLNNTIQTALLSYPCSTSRQFGPDGSSQTSIKSSMFSPTSVGLIVGLSLVVVFLALLCGWWYKHVKQQKTTHNELDRIDNTYTMVSTEGEL